MLGLRDSGIDSVSHFFLLGNSPLLLLEPGRLDLLIRLPLSFLFDLYYSRSVTQRSIENGSILKGGRGDVWRYSRFTGGEAIDPSCWI